jgi:hypothetical protein
VELLVAAGISGGACLLRRDEMNAYAAWKENPAPATKAELDRQKNITTRQHFVLAGVLWMAMGLITVPVIVRSRRKATNGQVNAVSI